jgi:hypothetical protein
VLHSLTTLPLLPPPPSLPTHSLRLQAVDVAPLAPAAAVSMVAFNDVLWETDSRLRAALQVTSASYGSAALSTQVFVRITPEAALVAIGGGVPFYESRCTISSGGTTGSNVDNVCYATSSALPSAFFNHPTLDPTREYGVQVTYGIVGSGSEVQHGRVPLRGLRRNVTYRVDDVVMTLDPRSLHSGEACGGDVWATPTYDVTAFTLIVETGGVLALQSQGVAYDATRWSVAISSAENRTVISGVVQSTFTPAVNPVAIQRLLQLSFRVAPTATASDSGIATMSVEMLAQHALGRVAVRGVPRGPGDPAPPASYHDRNGLHTGDAASVTIVNERAMGLLVAARDTALVNIGALTDVAVESNVSAILCRSCPRTPALGAVPCGARCDTVAAQCSSSTPNVLSADAATCVVSANESSASGAPVVNVTVSAGGLVATQRFSVHAIVPSSQGGPLVSVGVERTTMRAVQGWVTGQGCTDERFEGFPLRLTTGLSSRADGAVESVVDVTYMLRNLVRVRNASVATITNEGDEGGDAAAGGTILRGASSGSSVVEVVRSDDVVLGSSSSFTVTTSNYVVVRTLKLRLYTSLDLVQPNGSTAPLAALSGFSALAHASLGPLSVEGTRVTVVAIALMTDGSKVYVTPSMGLQLTSSNARVLNVTSPGIVTVGADSGNVTLSAAWSSNATGCNNTVGVGSLPVSVSLQVPESVSITVSSAMLANSADPAARIGNPYATTATVSVVLRFPGGVTRDVTSDSRLRVVAAVGGANGSSLITLDRVAGASGAFRVQALPGVDGTVGLRAILPQFGSDSVSLGLAGNNVNVSVVRFVSASLFTSPHPAYPGSTTVNKTEMFLIATSSVRQGLIARLSVTLSDGTTRDVSTSSHVSLRAFAPGDVLPSTSVVSASRTSSGFLVMARSEGSVNLVASFGGADNVARVLVTVSTQRTQVSQLVASFRSTLRGVVNEMSAQIAVLGEFEDGTVLTSMFDNAGTPLLPGVLNFVSLLPSVASVEAATGLVVLRANHYDVTSVRVSAAGSNASSDVVFACNLDPDDTDVDIGSASGLPVSPQHPGDVFDLGALFSSSHTHTTPAQLFASTRAIRTSDLSPSASCTRPRRSLSSRV